MQKIYNLKSNESLRKKLRNSPTSQEILLWSKIRREQLRYKFRRQHSIGRYVVDFYCPKKKLIIELDGWQHRKEVKGEYDHERTLFLESIGCRVLRFWNNDVNKNMSGVVGEIEKYL